MRKEEITRLLKASVYSEGELEASGNVGFVCACDMMSDVLSIMNSSEHPSGGVILVTSLNNPQVVRTAEMVDVHFVALTTGKIPSSETVELAEKFGIALISTPFSTFRSCGVLHDADLKDILEAGNRVG